MRFDVDPWDPAYGMANEAEVVEETTAAVSLDVERPARDWEPIGPSPGPVGRVLFVDGVRRIDARVWVDDGAGGSRPGICASYAAGWVCCDTQATMGSVELRRGLFTAYGEAEGVVTRAGEFPVRLSASDTPEALSLSLQQRMGEAEVVAAEAGSEESSADLLVIDGPLRNRQHLPGAVGYIKTHHVTYLPPELHVMVGGLGVGQRSPLFVIGEKWSRLSWYLRLPYGGTAPWSGVVRCECSADLAMSEALVLAESATATLPRFASEPHKESRAPQNLYPISGLERNLRRRMGSPQFLYRALRQAAVRSGATVGSPARSGTAS